VCNIILVQQFSCVIYHRYQCYFRNNNTNPPSCFPVVHNIALKWSGRISSTRLCRPKCSVHRAPLSSAYLSVCQSLFLCILWYLKLLKTKRNLPYIRNQSVPRCKHFPPRFIIIIINIKNWILWSVPSPELQLLAPTLLRSFNCSPSYVRYIQLDHLWSNFMYLTDVNTICKSHLWDKRFNFYVFPWM